jgi:integrase
VASRDRHVAKSEHEAQFGELADGFASHTTVGELSAWWLEHVARHRVRTLLVQILEQGVEFGLTTQNVARKVKAPKAAPKARRTITPDQTQLLIAECDPRFAAAAALWFVQGWRISEALGLAWQDLDLDEGSVQVRRTRGRGQRSSTTVEYDGRVRRSSTTAKGST